MHFDEILKIVNVYDCFSVNKDSLSFFDELNMFYLYNLNGEKLIDIKFEKAGLYKEYGDYLYFSFDNKLLALSNYSFSIETVYETEKEYIEILSTGDLFASSYNRGTRIYTNELIGKNCNNYISRWTTEMEYGIRYESDNIMIFSNRFKKIVSNVSFESGESRWIFEINEDIYGNIHKYHNTLIIPLKNNHLLGINAQTGEKLWELENCLNYYSLEEETGLLYGYARDSFDIVDVIKGEKILQKQLVGSMDKYQISPDQNMCALTDNGLYFVSNWKGTTKFGKVNIHAQEIEFVQELGVERGIKAQAPVYHNGRLYILDSVGTLHIFEE
jgi:hypothetical protein